MRAEPPDDDELRSASAPSADNSTGKLLFVGAALLVLMALSQAKQRREYWRAKTKSRAEARSARNDLDSGTAKKGNEATSMPLRSDAQMLDRPDATPRSQADDSHHITIRRALNNATLLFYHASETGMKLSTELIADIESARDAYTEGRWTTETAKVFWPRYGELCDLVKPATAESLIQSQGSENTGRSTLRGTLWHYRAIASLLMAFILPVSVVVFLNSSISAEINDQIKDDDAIMSTLQAYLINRSDTAGASATTGNAPAATSSTTPPLASAIGSTDILNFLQRFRRGITFLHERACKLYLLGRPLSVAAGVISGKEISHSECPNHRDILRDTENIRKAYQQPKETPELIAKEIEQYITESTFAKSVVQDNSVYYGAITSYILPILYAFLGSVAYTLRTLSEQVALRTYRQSYATFSRIIVGLIGGLVVGLFNNFAQGASLSPLAMAFLVGYGVEIFFSFLDALLETLRRARSGEQPSVAR